MRYTQSAVGFYILVLPCVGWPLALDDLVDGDVGLPAVHGPEGEAALLQLGLGVVPVLDKSDQN